MPRKKKPIKPPPPPWTPEEVRQVAIAIWGEKWQTPLAKRIAKWQMWPFPQSRVAKWYLEKDGRPIPERLQHDLAEMLTHSMEDADYEREQAREVLERHRI